VTIDTEPAEVEGVVAAYHRAWTSGNVDQALSFVSPSVQIEVPINSYPDRASFGDALVEFQHRIDSVTVLSEMHAGDQAMILYDIDVNGLGEMRVAEHFTVNEGVIVRLRQVHDTAAIRAAAARQANVAGFRKELDLAAPAPRVFDALTSLEGLSGWWASTAQGSALAGGQFTLRFAGLDEHITMRVDIAEQPGSVAWTCLEHTGLPDWEGTEIFFDCEDRGAGLTFLSFRHVGLVPELECYQQCHAGWEHFLDSLRSFVERGRGDPYGSQMN
jgi:uncharacterized protein YndB with AHSA1/START domain